MNNPLIVTLSNIPEITLVRPQFDRLSPLQRTFLVPFMVGFVTGIFILIILGLCSVIGGGLLFLSYTAAEVLPPAYPIMLK